MSDLPNWPQGQNHAPTTHPYAQKVWRLFGNNISGSRDMGGLWLFWSLFVLAVATGAAAAVQERAARVKGPSINYVWVYFDGS